MDQLEEFIAEMNLVESYSEKLSPQAFFIAGASSRKVSLKQSLKYLNFLQKKYQNQQINDTNKAIIQYKIYQGKLQQAKQIIKKLLKKPSNNLAQKSKNLQQETWQVLKTLKSDLEQERKRKRIKNTLQKTRQEHEGALFYQDCSLCSEIIRQNQSSALDTCSDSFHQECLHDYIIKKITENSIPILCPNHRCKTELSWADLQKRLSSEEVKVFTRQLIRSRASK